MHTYMFFKYICMSSVLHECYIAIHVCLHDGACTKGMQVSIYVYCIWTVSDRI